MLTDVLVLCIISILDEKKEEVCNTFDILKIDRQQNKQRK